VGEGGGMWGTAYLCAILGVLGSVGSWVALKGGENMAFRCCLSHSPPLSPPRRLTQGRCVAP
jgi:hypothetical protein